MSPEELQKKFGHLLHKREVPTLSPEQKKILVQQFRALPKERQAAIKQLLFHSCSFCEKELGLPNVGVSHGICNRHKEDMFKQMGRPIPQLSSTNPNQDLKTFSPEELKIAAYLTVLQLEKDKRNRKSKSTSTV